MEQEQQTPGQQALERIRLLLPNWQPTTQDVLRWIRLALIVGFVILGVLFILDVIGLLFGITLLKLLKVLALPITVGAAVPLLNWLQKKRELDVENQRAQDEALQAYLDQMAQLMLLDEADEAKPKPLRKSAPRDEVRILARARTLTVLRRLGSERKRSIVDFLYEADLIKFSQPIIQLGSPDAQYSAADLSGADLRGAFLLGAHLTGPMSGVNLSRADLSGADLSGADLRRANLSHANLSHANLTDADLSWADLTDTLGAKENLGQAKSLEGATMPDGQQLESPVYAARPTFRPTFKDWLKSNDSGQDGENPG